MSDCLFCNIVVGEIPSSKVAESDVAYAFDDIAPQAPVHVLVVPKMHHTSADHLPSDHAGIVELVHGRRHPGVVRPRIARIPALDV